MLVIRFQGRLAPHECRAAVAGLPGKRGVHPDDRPHAQPRVTAIVPTRREDGGQTDPRSGTGHGVSVTRTAHSTHSQAVIPALPGSRAAYFRSHVTIHAGIARRNVQPGRVVPGEALFPSRLPERRVTFSLPSSPAYQYPPSRPKTAVAEPVRHRVRQQSGSGKGLRKTTRGPATGKGP